MQFRKKQLLRGCCLALFLLILPGDAQDQAPEPPHIRSEVKEVLVPLVVTNGHGRHITGLKASDFQVFEDGKPERIIAFRTELMPGPSSSAPEVPESGRTTAAAAPATAARRADDPRQTYLVLIDTLHSSFANINRVRDALKKFFEKEQSAEAQYALIALGRTPTVVQDSTRDASAILAAIRSNAFSKNLLDSESANLAATADQFAALMRAYCSYCGCLSAGSDADLPQCPDAKGRVQAFLNSYSERAYILNEQFLRELRKIVEAIATMPTSRTIVFLSDGFNRYPGRELYAILLGYGPKDRSFEFNPRNIQPELDAILKFATAKDVKFYTIDSRGLYTTGAAPGSGFDASSSSHIHTQMDARGSPNIAAGVPEAVTSNATSAARESADPLAQLAHETGGLFFENNNDLVKGVRQAVEDGREYYVLSYVPENNALDGKYRHIQVTVKGGKWQVHAKAGYWATP
jgi:VWFA-related protein